MLQELDVPALYNLEICSANRHNIVEEAYKDGWICENGAVGKYAQVLVKDNIAMKIFEDTAYSRYLEVIKYSENPYFPKVVNGPFHGNNLSVVFLERLRKMEPHEDTQLCYNIACYLASVDIAEDNKTRILFYENIKWSLGKAGIEALNIIDNICKNFAFCTDVHKDNVMIRDSGKEKHYVITDALKIEPGEKSYWPDDYEIEDPQDYD